MCISSILLTASWAVDYQGVNLGSEGDGVGLSFAMAGPGSPAALFINSTSGAVSYSEFNGSSWVVTQLASGYQAGGDTALLFVGGQPHAFFYSDTSNVLTHAVRTGATWITEPLAADLDIAGDLQAVLCGNEICLSVYDERNGDLYLMRGNTGGWTRQAVVQSSRDTGAMNDIGALPNGNAVLVYYDATAQTLNIAVQNGGSWLIDTVSYMDSHIGMHPSLAVGADGSLHLSFARYKSAATLPDTAVYYARKLPGAVWEFALISDDYAGGETAIVLDAGGFPAVLFRHLRFSIVHGDFSAMVLARLQISGYWELQLLPPELGGAGNIYSYAHSSLVRDPGGYPVAAYHFSRGPYLGQPASARYRVHAATGSLFLDGGGSSSSSTSSSGGSSSTTSSSSSTSTSSSSSSSTTTSSSGTSSSSSTSSSGGTLDSDGDGLNDFDEGQYGTNPFDPDHDDDGVWDGQEVSDGSNPLDRGSHIQMLGTKICSEWNSFFKDMWNVFEHANLGLNDLQVATQLYSIDGSPLYEEQFSLQPGSQYDALVHGYPGIVKNSYGKVCSRHDGFSGDMDGRMVYYKPTAKGAGLSFDFAFAMPMVNGKKGRQYVSFNTYQPSFHAKDQGNLVANWVQLTNVSDSPSSGTLRFYSITGFMLDSLQVVLAAGERRDFAAHQWGPSQVGLVEWHPDSDDQQFQLRNVRYVYDNRGNRETFDTAFQLEGVFGTGEEVLLPFTTENGQMSVVELSNVTDQWIAVRLRVFASDDNFSIPLEQQIVFGPKQTQHIILNTLLGDELFGAVTVRSDTLSSVVAVQMQYARNQSGQIEYMYGVQGVEPLAAVLRGSYNTYLSQEATLVLINSLSVPQVVQLQMVRNDGASVAMPTGEAPAVGIPANGMTRYDLTYLAGADQYGVIIVIPEQRNSVVGHVLRSRGVEYVMPTPLRR